MGIMSDGLLWTFRDWFRTCVPGLPRYGYGTFFRLTLDPKYRRRVTRP
jgi:hypothetical protein